MDLFAILNLIALANDVIATARSNDDVATKIKKIATPLVPALEALANHLFPGVSNPVAAGATAMDVALVKRIQAALQIKGYDLDVDGLYGPLTKKAVEEFQAANNLTVDGWAGKNTQAVLFA